MSCRYTNLKGRSIDMALRKGKRKGKQKGSAVKVKSYMRNGKRVKAYRRGRAGGKRG